MHPADASVAPVYTHRQSPASRYYLDVAIRIRLSSRDALEN
jgi:hypothetical protein